MTQIQFRDVLEALRFLLEHQSFADSLIYASIRQYNDDDSRIYNEMHTED